MILIVSHRRGFEADRVIDQLRGLGESVFRFNTDLSASEPKYSLRFTTAGLQCRLFNEKGEVDIADVGTAWFQQPFCWKEPRSAIEFAQQSSHQTAINALLGQVKGKWLNSPKCALLAANKVNQLYEANRVGLIVPQTLISNEPRTIRQFVSENVVTVAKSVAPQWLSTPSGDFAAYTQKVEADWLHHDETLSYSPVVYQEFHERQRDIRVVVVGDEVFSAASAAHDKDSVYDVRKTSATLYTRCILADRIIASLRKMIGGLGLQFCSADFIESQDGSIYFIDLNVTGSWWWVDDVFDGAITKAIAIFLATGSKNKCSNAP